MLDSPGFEILIGRSPVFRYHGPEAWRERVESLASRIRDGVSGSTATHSVGANAHPPRARRDDPPEFRVEICREIPPHAGLGSGTQLALALAAGLARFLGGEHFTAESLARCASRGTRSALGIHGFLKGGFLIDAGKLPHEELGTLTARAECPSAWRFVLVTPLGKAGFVGGRRRPVRRLAVRVRTARGKLFCSGAGGDFRASRDGGTGRPPAGARTPRGRADVVGADDLRALRKRCRGGRTGARSAVARP